MAFVFSLLFHALLFVTIEAGFRAGIWNARLFLPGRAKPDEARLAALKERVRPKEEEMPLVFVDVDPSQATAEPPPETKYYSARNSKAANPDTSRDTLTPRSKVNRRESPKPWTRLAPGRNPSNRPPNLLQPRSWRPSRRPNRRPSSLNRNRSPPFGQVIWP